MGKRKAINDIINCLAKNPSEENWELFERLTRNTQVKFYKILFREGNSSIEREISNSFALIYDEKRNKIASLPIHVSMQDGNLRGSLCYLKNLERMG